MRRMIYLSLALGMAAIGAAPPESSVNGDGYRTLGEMAVQHSGRVKPLDTYARLMVKQVYTRETIKLLDDKGDVVARWEPLAALLDWQARPEFWDKQEIIAVEYLPLKQKLLSVPAREALAALARSGRLSDADKARVEKASRDPNVTTADLKAAAALPGVPPEMKTTLKTLAHKISPDQKWLSSDDLETGRLDVDGHEVAYMDWFAELAGRRSPRPDLEEPIQYTPIEKKGLEAAEKLVLYMALRDGNPKGNPMYDVYVTPRPLNKDYLKFTNDAVAKIRKGRGQSAAEDDITPLENDVLSAFGMYAKDIKARDRRDPGEDAEFDAKLVEWLREKSSWVPLRLILSTDIAELKRAGFDEARILAFRKAYEATIAAEKSHPGSLPAETARTMLAAARDLGESTAVPYLLKKDTGHSTWNEYTAPPVESPYVALRLASRILSLFSGGNTTSADRVAAFKAVRDPLAASSAPISSEKEATLLASARAINSNVVAYPSEAEMGREVTFNFLAPFYKAPMAYGAALVLLLMSLGASAGPNAKAGPVERGLYGLGMLSFLGGIGWEIIGFYYRVRISGWAPVTNMYETVIWVALVTSVLGLVLELIYRKTYSAVAASGVALLATVLAANVSLLDPDIKNLTPVLRSNYWLTIHVLTIVSSYAAFALAMGLGLLAIGYYLSATYRRDVSYAALARPLIPSLPMLLVGVAGLIGTQSAATSTATPSAMSTYGLGTLAMLGLIGTIISAFGLIGEVCSRAPAKALTGGVFLLALGTAGLFGVRSMDSPAWWPETISLAVPPAVVAGLGAIVVLLSRMGAMARAPLSAGAEKSADEMADLPPADMSAEAAFGTSGGTMTKPTVAQIRAKQEASRPTYDPRTLSMQSTAARIKPLSNFAYRAMQVGVLLVAAGTILGGVWADVSWGRFWGWDAKEVWALITLLVYLVPLHGRFAGWVNTFGLIASTVVCFSAVLMAWYGVNFVLSTGLHAYGFTEGGGQGVVLTASLSVLAVVAATWNRRRLGSIA